MEKWIKNLLVIDPLVLIASTIYGNYDLIIMLLAIQIGIIFVIFLARYFMRKVRLDGELTIEPLPEVYERLDFQFPTSPLDVDGITIQPIPPSPETAIVSASSGMKTLGPEDNIPEEVSCSICGKNILGTREDYGGVLVCTYPDCGQWYHKNHFYDTAKGKCISPLCRKRGSSLSPVANPRLPSTFELL